MNPTHLRGILAPVVTPFDESLKPDKGRFVNHCTWLLGAGCHALAAFGTNSEANSMSVEERMALLEALVDSRVDPMRLIPGTGCCALTDTVMLTRHAVELGCAGALMLPPFYYKGVSGEGLFRAFAETIERVGDDRLRVYLYHIPPVAQVGFSHKLIQRLVDAFPGIVIGMKDSSGDWDHIKSVMDAFPGFDVFSGNELSLLDNLRHGGVGCITATANVNPGPLRALFDTWDDGPEAERLQERISHTRSIISRYPVIPAMKAVIAGFSRDASWCRVRPPLVELPGEDQEALIEALSREGFEMPELASS